MTSPNFGDRVRVATAPETEATGFAGRVGEVWSEVDSSEAGVGPVIGDRGEGSAVSVLFEDTEDVVWFAPYLLKRVERARSPSRRLPFVFFGALALVALTAVAQIGRSRVGSFALVRASTPCLPVPGYATSGAYPNVRGGSQRVIRTNVALRRVVVRAERRYAPSARRHQVRNSIGIYQTAIDRGLTSASTVVVSALIPALELYPGGSGGQTWISATIDVRSGKVISLRQLLANPPLALAVLASEWKAQLRHTVPGADLAKDADGYTPSFGHYRNFALTPTGLAFGFGQGPAGSRISAVIPYRLVHPYLTPLGKRLVAGVRRPKPAHSQGQNELAGTWPQHSPPAAAVSWPSNCT